MSDAAAVNEVERNRMQVSNALWLLDFAVSSGVEVPDETLQAIHRAQDLTAATTLPSIEERLAFDRAYAALARQVSPVTADTLRWTSDQYAAWLAKRSGPDAHQSWFAPWGPVSDAKIWSRKLWVITVGVILALFVCEPFVESKVSKPDPAATPQPNAAAAGAALTATTGPKWNVLWQTAQAAKPTPVPQQRSQRGTPTSTPTVTTTPSATTTLSATRTQPPSTPTQCAPLHNLVVNTKGPGLLCMLGTLLGRMCPFLWGALGALAFLLRTCHEFIHRREFDQRRVPEYYNRILLGAVSGGAIQMYVQNQFENIGVGANAVAFVAGYNTDLLFSYLDRIFSALLPKEPSSATNKPAAPPPATAASNLPTGPATPQPDERVARIQRLLAETLVPDYAVAATDGIWDDRTRLAIIAFLRSNYPSSKAFAATPQAPDFAAYDREQLIAAMSTFVLPASTT
jgi:hypothetical protein